MAKDKKSIVSCFLKSKVSNLIKQRIRIIPGERRYKHLFQSFLRDTT